MVKKRDWRARRTAAFGRIATAPAIGEISWVRSGKMKKWCGRRVFIDGFGFGGGKLYANEFNGYIGLG